MELKDVSLAVFCAALLGAVTGAARAADFTPRPVKVAVIDTGINPALMGELQKRLLPGKNILDTSSSTADIEGHGTEMAKAVLGHCSDCLVFPIKVTQRGAGIRSSDLARAVRAAVKLGANVINVSFGLLESSSELRSEIQGAVAKETVIITAAGVGVPNPFRPMALHRFSPQSDPHVVVVGSSDSMSNFGPELDLVVSEPKGSSFAAAEVSGTAANLLAESPRMTPTEVRHSLRTATLPESAPADDEDHAGFGRLSDLRSVQPSKVVLSGRLHQGPITHIDLSATKDIHETMLNQTCGEGENSKQVQVLSQNSLKKGRARVKLPKFATGSDVHCTVHVTARFHDRTEAVWESNL